MVAQTGTIEWEAPEHYHVEKGSDWYWALGILALAIAVTALLLGNILFAIVVLLGAFLMALVGLRGPRTITFAVTPRGVRIGDDVHPYTTLASFYIEEDDPRGPQLLLRSRRALVPLLVLPLPLEELEAVDNILAERLPEEELEESFAQRLLEFLGF
jgi:hypothetical protein